MSESVISTRHLNKFYGKKRGIVDVNIDVCEGEVYGCLGPNGAGKTTTIRILMDFIRPDRGSARVFGRDAREDSVQIHKRVGYLPGELSLYSRLTVGNHLTYFANLRGIDCDAVVSSLAERLDCDLSKPIRTLSQGNKQKVGLIQSLMFKPDLLILDEPTNGLDPLIRQEFFHIIEELKNEGKTIFLSSHVLSEVERICDRVGIIKAGRIVAVEKVVELHEKNLRRVEIRFNEDLTLEPFLKIANLRDISLTDRILRCQVWGDMDPLIKAAARFIIRDMSAEQPHLEEVFLAYYGENHDV